MLGGGGGEAVAVALLHSHSEVTPIHPQLVSRYEPSRTVCVYHFTLDMQEMQYCVFCMLYNVCPML